MLFLVISLLRIRYTVSKSNYQFIIILIDLLLYYVIPTRMLYYSPIIFISDIVNRCLYAARYLKFNILISNIML